MNIVSKNVYVHLLNVHLASGPNYRLPTLLTFLMLFWEKQMLQFFTDLHDNITTRIYLRSEGFPKTPLSGFTRATETRFH